MCQRVTCKTCGKATYRGCGMHVEQVLSGVPASERCDCDQTRSASAGVSTSGGGFFSRLFGSRKS